MKKVFLSFIFSSLFILSTMAKPIEEGDTVVYSPFLNTWSTESQSFDSILLTKKLTNTMGSFSQYCTFSGDSAFVLDTTVELLRNEQLLVVDNDMLQFSKIVYNDEGFEKVSLSIEEIRKVFPEAEIVKLSWLTNDNKLWIHKPFLKTKTILLVNDTDKYFHRLSSKNKKIQDSNIRGLIKISRYGIYKFTHCGERDGKITIYVR